MPAETSLTWHSILFFLLTEVNKASSQLHNGWRMKFILPLFGQERQSGEDLRVVEAKLHFPMNDAIDEGSCKMEVHLGKTHKKQPLGSSTTFGKTQRYKTYKLDLKKVFSLPTAKTPRVHVHVSCHSTSTAFSEHEANSGECMQRCRQHLPNTLAQTFLALHVQQSKVATWTDLGRVRSQLNKQLSEVKSTNPSLPRQDISITEKNRDVSLDKGNIVLSSSEADRPRTPQHQGPPPVRLKRAASDPCARHELTVNLTQLKLEHLFVGPQMVDIGHCQGTCLNILDQEASTLDTWHYLHELHASSNNHDLLHQTANFARGVSTVVEPCCRAIDYDHTRMVLMFFDETVQLFAEIATVPDMVIKSCGCQ